MVWSATNSLRARLLGLLLLAIVLTAAAQSLVVYQQARAEADSIFDYHMQQMAQALRNGVTMPTMPVLDDELAGSDDFDFVVQVWSADGARLFHSSAKGELPQRAVLGFSEMRVAGAPYRVYSLQTRTQVIQVAQDMAPRREMARTLALRTVAPIVWMAPLLMLIAWWVVSASLRPVARVAQQVAKRQADDLSTLAEAGVPDEIAPLVHELNLLFARVREAFDAQRYFVADAAHELRSPLAALRLQVQGLQRARDEATRELALERLLAGIDRATRLVEQLLLLARQQASASSGEPAQPVPLVDLARAALVDAAALAQQRGIDLGLAQADAVAMLGHPDALRILLRNLLDNAIRYTPEGGRIDVSVQREGDALLLLVDDSGPGIAEADRARVLDRFYRVQGSPAGGSGLGLAIVHAIAQMHGASLTLSTAPGLGGLRVQLRFPHVD
jgi:two-component system OmpR family sensor kinase